jgi:hypothetical protein
MIPWKQCGVQEDDEEDLKAMEGSARALNRADFETDEQFQSYKSSKEAAPKAAFQFGVKVCPAQLPVSAVACTLCSEGASGWCDPRLVSACPGLANYTIWKINYRFTERDGRKGSPAGKNARHGGQGGGHLPSTEKQLYRRIVWLGKPHAPCMALGCSV